MTREPRSELAVGPALDSPAVKAGRFGRPAAYHSAGRSTSIAALRSKRTQPASMKIARCPRWPCSCCRERCPFSATADRPRARPLRKLQEETMALLIASDLRRCKAHYHRSSTSKLKIRSVVPIVRVSGAQLGRHFFARPLIPVHARRAPSRSVFIGGLSL